VSSLLESEWRQGTVLPHKLLPDGTVPPSVTADTKLVIISHDCDLVNNSYTAEPFLEFFVAWPKPNDARDGRMFFGKNPRRIQFVAQENGEDHLYEIDVQHKYRVGRKILETGTRDTTIKIRAKDVLVIAKWAARRYHRPSLPTALLNRITPQVKSKLSKKMEKDGEDVRRVWVGLNTLEELPANEPYRLILRITVPTEVCEDDAKEQRALSIVSEMRTLLAQCEGVEVEDADLATESDLTLDDIRRMSPWDFDYLSPDEEQSAN
jgi:hypothetical protein